VPPDQFQAWVQQQLAQQHAASPSPTP
jgi:heme/copper-type cytochrome/quinol oxidase subunit 2